jgi:hypothetical protein
MPVLPWGRLDYSRHAHWPSLRDGDGAPSTMGWPSKRQVSLFCDRRAAAGRAGNPVANLVGLRTTEQDPTSPLDRLNESDCRRSLQIVQSADYGERFSYRGEAYTWPLLQTMCFGRTARPFLQECRVHWHSKLSKMSCGRPPLVRRMLSTRFIGCRPSVHRTTSLSHAENWLAVHRSRHETGRCNAPRRFAVLSAVTHAWLNHPDHRRPRAPSATAGRP